MTSVVPLTGEGRQKLAKPPSSATSASPAKPQNGKAEELIPSKATLADLQTKRLHALKLYQEEKSRRILETERAESLATQLHLLSLHQKPAAVVESSNSTSSIIHTDFFVAEVRSLGMAQGGLSASLTWHCLAMAEVLACPPQNVVVAEKREGIHSNSSQVCGCQDRQTSLTDKQRSSGGQTGNFERNLEESIAELKARLRRAEIAAEEAQRSTQRNEQLIENLKAQLDASTAACQDLVETVKEQEDTIERLS